MYAINHAATALIIKKKSPVTPLFPLLIAVQLVELLWVLFSYLGLEHIKIAEGVLHLNFLPYSHSIFSGVILAVLAWAIIRLSYNNNNLGIAIAVGILSHTFLNILFHEKDIHVAPFLSTPLLGFNITSYPMLDFALEIMYGIFCWWYFKGNRKLLLTIIVFNLLDLPMMMGKGDALIPFEHNPYLLPTIILIQTLITGFFVWKYSKKGNTVRKDNKVKVKSELATV